MTIEQDKAIKEAGEILKRAFGNFYGSIRFNLHPDRKMTNVNIASTVDIEESKIYPSK